MKHPWRCVPMLLAALSLMGTLHASWAQRLPFQLHDNTLRVSVTHPLPESVSSGMSAMYVELENNGAVERKVQLLYEPEYGSRQRFEIHSEVSVPAGSKLRHEMLLPAFVNLNSGEFSVWSAGESDQQSSLSIKTGEHGGLVAPVLVLGDGLANNVETAVWEASLARSDLNAGRGSSSTSVLLDLQLAYVGPENLPRRFESYSGLAALLIDTSFPATEVLLEPALRWARLGGTLIFSGPDADRYAARIAGLEAWMQERFRYVNAQQSASNHGVDIYHLGLGKLAISEADTFLDSAQLPGLQSAIYTNRGFMPITRDRYGVRHHLARLGSGVAITGTGTIAPLPSYLEAKTLDGVGELPYRLFILLLIGFFALVAPLNFRLVKRTGRPAWLLFTIPALAAVASASFLGYGIFYQGLGLTLDSTTFSVLDQREHRAQTIGLRTFFAGIAPRASLQPEAGSMVIPILEDGWRSPPSFHRIDMGSSLNLKGDYLPVRSEATQVVFSDRAARGRLAFRAVGDSFEVSNGLGAAIRQLALRVPGGELHLFSPPGPESIADGGSQLMLPAGDVPTHLLSWLDTPRAERDLGWAEDLPQAMYLAILDSNPFADSTGLEPDDELGIHELFGVLSMDMEDWK